MRGGFGGRGDRGGEEKALPCVIRVVRVSGTIKKAEEELIRRARRDIVRAKLSLDGSGNQDGVTSNPDFTRSTEEDEVIDDSSEDGEMEDLESD